MKRRVTVQLRLRKRDYQLGQHNEVGRSLDKSKSKESGSRTVISRQRDLRGLSLHSEDGLAAMVELMGQLFGQADPARSSGAS